MKHIRKRLELVKELHTELHAELNEQLESIHEKIREQEEPTPEARLKEAKTIYHDIMEQLDAICRLLQASDRSVSPELLKKGFDIMLQAALLRTAVGDNDFSHIERQFITSLAEYGDVVEWANLHDDRKKEDLTWGKLFYLEEDELSNLIDSISSTGKAMMKQVFLPIVTADSLSEVSYQDVILDEVKDICKIFQYIDGDGENQAEHTAMRRAIQVYFERPIREAREEVQKQLQQESEAPTVS